MEQASMKFAKAVITRQEREHLKYALFIEIEDVLMARFADKTDVFDVEEV